MRSSGRRAAGTRSRRSSSSRTGPGGAFVLALSHEETVTQHALELQSYRQLPQLWYHFQTKERDEPRPRGGLIRMREFIMKDSYSFDRDEAGLDESFEKNRAAYHRIFERCGDRGACRRGGVRDDGRQARASTSSPRPARARTRSSSARTATTRPTSTSRAPCRGRRSSRSGSMRRRRSTHPASRRSRVSRSSSGIDAAATSKAMPVVKADGTLVLALVRGDDRLSESKLLSLFSSDFRPADDEEIRAAFGAGGGSLGPVGVECRGDRRRDASRRAVRRRREPGRRATCAASRPGATTSRGSPTSASRGTATRVPNCGGRLVVHPGDRGRSHLQARHVLLGAVRRHVPRRVRARSARS